MAARRFPPRVVRALSVSKILGIRAGSGPHRFIGVWVVVVGERVFVRSWYVKATGWHAVLREEPRATIHVGDRELRVRTVFIKSARVMDAVDDAYAAKYNTPASAKWVRGFRMAKCRATTTELVPA